MITLMNGSRRPCDSWGQTSTVYEELRLCWLCVVVVCLVTQRFGFGSRVPWSIHMGVAYPCKRDPKHESVLHMSVLEISDIFISTHLALF